MPASSCESRQLSDTKAVRFEPQNLFSKRARISTLLNGVRVVIQSSSRGHKSEISLKLAEIKLTNKSKANSIDKQVLSFILASSWTGSSTREPVSEG